MADGHKLAELMWKLLDHFEVGGVIDTSLSLAAGAKVHLSSKHFKRYHSININKYATYVHYLGLLGH